MIMLSVAYAANCGGTGTLTGTGSNLVLKGILSSLGAPINFANWMGYAVPGMLINIMVCWAWLQFWFLDYPNPLGWAKDLFTCGRKREGTDSNSRDARIKAVLREEYRQLGSISFHEFAVGILFLLLVFLWVFRDPQFMVGWGNYVEVE